MSVKLRIPSKHVRFLTVGQAALVAGLERGTIARLVKQGRLASTVIPGDVKQYRRIPRAEVETLMRLMEEGLEEDTR
jgi:excisionase family DNA binding protein